MRRACYDSEAYMDRLPPGRHLTAPTDKPEWSYNNPQNAKESIRNHAYAHLPPEGPIKADRRYTKEFIRRAVEAYQLSRDPGRSPRS
ncbi:hypothetical protein PINS_up003608 [Pythium insidiosum]|nr:hypothetical protein PINS_up003608 [Pythium insidiosum]